MLERNVSGIFCARSSLRNANQCYTSRKKTRYCKDMNFQAINPCQLLRRGRAITQVISRNLEVEVVAVVVEGVVEDREGEGVVGRAEVAMAEMVKGITAMQEIEHGKTDEETNSEKAVMIEKWLKWAAPPHNAFNTCYGCYPKNILVGYPLCLRLCLITIPSPRFDLSNNRSYQRCSYRCEQREINSISMLSREVK